MEVKLNTFHQVDLARPWVPPALSKLDIKNGKSPRPDPGVEIEIESVDRHPDYEVIPGKVL
jgi:hypothetical protein